ncbi:MAG: hypothetical protein AB8B83_09710 [Bdellovibrionales bacterium]
MIKYILPTLLVAVLLTFPSMAQDGHEGHDHSAHDHSQHAGEPELIITPISPSALKAGEENEVTLFIQDVQAKPVDVSQFEVVHTQPVHLLIIEPGLKDYHHAHPIQKTTGQYVFNFTPQTACSYRIWADVQLKGSHQQYIPVDLQGTEGCNEPMDKTVNLEASAQGYDFKLQLEGDLKAGEAVVANISISKDDQPVDFLEPVMGAFAHMVGFYDDYKTIAHIHPMGAEPKEYTQRGGPILRFHIEPEQVGYLKLFAQVQIDGRQVFAPFGLMIK